MPIQMKDIHIAVVISVEIVYVCQRFKSWI